ncbi:hypothetical protein BACI349Y_810051 [Bacillus sp. 349Y]|nr:hypothetical protein BACI349Y_810051 [Bacillus sp. 349Y]
MRMTFFLYIIDNQYPMPHLISPLLIKNSLMVTNDWVINILENYYYTTRMITMAHTSHHD